MLADDDRVDLSNLHRQILYRQDSVGRDKLDEAKRALVSLGVEEQRIELVRSRFLPDNARSLAASVDLVLEGADNYATKFLTADACYLERRPVVHGAAVRFVSTVLFSAPGARPCYRCLFEDVPPGAQQNCAEAGVLGPLVGFAGALMADFALRALASDEPLAGKLLSYSALEDELREITVSENPACPLCGKNPQISRIEETRYTAPSCAA